MISCAFCADGPRQRILLDDSWRFQLEPQIVAPSGGNSVAITDWVMKESPAGQADAAAMNAPEQDASTWTPIKAAKTLPPYPYL